MMWIVRQFYEGMKGGTDEALEDAERVEADDPEEAAAVFMEGVQETGDLYEWIGDHQRCDLLVRGENDTTDHLIEVTVDWSPNFYASEKPSPAERNPSVPSCEWPSCRHPTAKHTAEGCGVLHCRCKCSPLPETAT